MAPVKAVLAAALETALNRYLALDSQVGKLLHPLAGKVIAITVLPFGETLYLCPSRDNIQVLDAYPNPPDAHLAGTPWALGLMGISNQPMQALFSGSVRIDGNIHVGQRFQDLFKRLDIDLEPKLARYTGEHFANGLFGLIRSGQDWGRQSFETFEQNLSEFLQEETRELPSAPELAIFFRQVDTLRTDYDRLQSRIERLSRLKNSEQPQAINLSPPKMPTDYNTP